jgi:signal transduction histidine kinase/ActR/RegA family two-component response regulator/HPt (histidine-containing phosphotransfer) domain-containing protein
MKPRELGFALLAALLVSQEPLLAQAPSASAKPAPTLSAAERDWLKQHGPIRFGVPEFGQPPIDILGESGDYEGLTPDFLKLIQSRFGLKIDFVRLKTIDEMREAVKAGTIDMTGSLVERAVLENELIFSQPYIRNLGVVVARRDDSSVRTTEDLSNKRVAVERGRANAELLKKTFPGITLVEADSTAAALRAVSVGAASAYVGGLGSVVWIRRRDALANLEVRSEAPEFDSEIRFAVRKNLPVLAAIVNKGVEGLTANDREQVRQRWISAAASLQSAPKLVIAAESREWLKRHGPVRYGVPEAAWPPFDLFGASGEHQGVTADYLRLVQQRLGFPLEIVSVATFNDALAALRERGIDVMGSIAYTDARAEFALFSPPYVKSAPVIIARKDEPHIKSIGDLADKTVAIEKGFVSEEILPRRFPGIRLLLFESTAEALGAVSTGKADAYVGGLVSSAYLIDKGYLTNLEVRAPAGFPTSEIRFAVRKDLPELARLFDHALADITEEEHAAIRDKWLRVQSGIVIDWRELLRYLLPIAAALLIVIAVVVVWNRRLQAQIVMRREAEHAADAANRAKSAFLATMSHEIRTPMNGVLGMLELLGLTRLDADQRSSLETVRESAKSLLRIIDDILDFSKIEAGKLEVRPEVASISDAIEGVYHVYSGVASSKDIELRKFADPGISLAVRVDPLRLRQVLNNFVSNALKFTQEGSVEIRAELLERKDGMDVVRFSVKDTGIGIAKENQEKLFQPFVQAEGDTTRRFGGTGLGLAICRRLAELMNGTIEMSSEPGVGTTMSLTVALPIADPKDLPAKGNAAAEAVLALASRRAAPTVEQARAEGTLVLAVDDHPTNRALLKRQLNTLGYAVETAENGLEALRMWKSGRFAIVITDCHMPEMDGYELARSIRNAEADNGRARIPIVACTANVLAGEAENCYAAGMDSYVAKPVEMRALVEALERWLPLPGAKQPQETVPQPPPVGTAGDAPVDRSALAEITGGDAAMERDILLDFRGTNDGDAAVLIEALDKRDIALATRASHRIKGASRTIGALSLADVCERIERAGRANDWGTMSASREAFEHELERLNAWLRPL